MSIRHSCFVFVSYLASSLSSLIKPSVRRVSVVSVMVGGGSGLVVVHHGGCVGVCSFGVVGVAGDHGI